MAAIDELLAGFEHIETRAEFQERLKSERPLRIKLGLDPTSADLHLGHAVLLERLQRFVEAGHDVTLIIGDFTARIGDPSGRNDARPPLSDEQIAVNMKTYAEQAGKVLDLERVKLRYNSEWLAPLKLEGLLRLLSHVTVAQMLKREDFAKRYGSNTPISLHEFLYPIAQAYDSVALEADVELGGNDQLFNVLMGRFYQNAYGQKPQICLTAPLLEGIDGTKKMSKSTGNYIGLAESPSDQFGKTMRIPDELIARWDHMLLGTSHAAAALLAQRIGDGSVHPMDEKKRIAEAIVTRYHSAADARRAREGFERTVQRGEAPTDMSELMIEVPMRVDALLVAANFAESKRAAHRLISSGGVRIDGHVVTDLHMVWNLPSGVLSMGSRRYLRVLCREK